MASAIDQATFDKLEKFFLECRDDAKDVQKDLNERFTQFEEDYDFSPREFKAAMRWKILAAKNPLKARIAWDNFKLFIKLSRFEDQLAPMLGDGEEANEAGFAETTVKRRRGRPPGSKNRGKAEYGDNVTPLQADGAAA